MARIITPAAAERRRAQQRTARRLKKGQPTLPKSITEPVKKATKKAREKNQDLVHRAFVRFYDELHEYFKFNVDTVREGVYDLMTDEQLEWTSKARAEDIRARASIQDADAYMRLFGSNDRNVWWYH